MKIEKLLQLTSTAALAFVLSACGNSTDSSTSAESLSSNSQSFWIDRKPQNLTLLNGTWEYEGVEFHLDFDRDSAQVGSASFPVVDPVFSSAGGQANTAEHLSHVPHSAFGTVLTLIHLYEIIEELILVTESSERESFFVQKHGLVEVVPPPPALDSDNWIKNAWDALFPGVNGDSYNTQLNDECYGSNRANPNSDSVFVALSLRSSIDALAKDTKIVGCFKMINPDTIQATFGQPFTFGDKPNAIGSTVNLHRAGNH
ncbi:MAG: hypothetical protein HRU19_01850 [Pseudobacteriovorax sp.]|nr:hypothetical protein [Pseudobacteriovorax sp.]